MTSRRRKLTARPLTEIDLLGWLSQAQAGDTLEYHRGFLALDRSSGSEMLNKKDQITLSETASLAMRLADKSLVHLVQRRICRNHFSYLAIARPRPHSTPLSLLTLAFKEAV